MDAEHLLIRFLHDAGGAAWFGASVFANVVLLPFVMRQPVDRQRDLVSGLLRTPERFIIVAALLAAATGLARGLWSGRIDSVPASPHSASARASWTKPTWRGL